MPLSSKGETIKTAMQKEYGGEEGERIFYASKNAGTISGVDAAGLLDEVKSLCDSCESLNRRIDAYCARRADDCKADAAWPTGFKRNGSTYEATGKKGKDRATGEESREYEKVDRDGNFTGARIWRTESGTIKEE